MIFKIFPSPYQVVDPVELHPLLRLVRYLLPDPVSNWYAPTLRTGGTGDQSPQLVQLFTETRCLRFAPTFTGGRPADRAVDIILAEASDHSRRGSVAENGTLHPSHRRAQPERRTPHSIVRCQAITPHGLIPQVVWQF